MTNVYSPVTTILSNGPRGFIISEIVEFQELVRKEQKSYLHIQRRATISNLASNWFFRVN